MFNVIASAIISLLVLLILLKTNLVTFALDTPNHRSLHTKLTPRTGGLGIMIGVLVSYSLLSGLTVWMMMLIGLILVSFVDDVITMPIVVRFFVQLVITTIFIYIFLPQSPWYIKSLSLLGIVWITNLYNFMDGSDGLAAGMSIFGFSTYSLAAYQFGNIQLVIMCASVASACLVFLFFNFFPAKIFMGDSGAIPLGFLAGAIGLYGWELEVWSLWFPILVFSPFIIDATVTLFKRAVRKEKVWQAHREHYYQRLIQLGWGHKKTALAEYLLMMMTATSAIFMRSLSEQYLTISLLIWIGLYILLLISIDQKWHAFITHSKI